MTPKSTIWFTGLSLSGKTVLAKTLAEYLRSGGEQVEVLDGKFIRDELTGFFGYSREERIKVSRVLALEARLLARNGIIPIVTSITPYQESRDFNRRELAPYLEIYVDCPLSACMTRDPQNLYRRAMRGDLKHFIGVDDPYEIPRQPDFRIETASRSIQESQQAVCAFVANALNLQFAT